MALSPEYLQGLPEELENLALQFEADIIADISRRIAKAGSITDTAEYEMMLLKEMGAATDYLEKLTAQYLGVSDQTVKDMVFDAAQTDSDFYETVYASANRPYVPFEYNDYLQRLADAAVNQTCGELTNFTRSMGFSARGSDGRIYFKSAAKTYRSAMDKAFFYAAAGMDYQTAVRRATKEITASGLQFVDYASGVRNHVDVAVRRALLTGVSQMTGEISLHNAGELDTDVVEVSAHAGARPDHAEWQGRWYSLTGKDKRYPLLADVTGYGSVEGLKGANCRHDFYPVIPDVSVPAYTDEQLKNIDPEPVEIDGKTYTLYEAQQKQRAYERAIRKTKREIIAAEASGDSDMFTAKSVLLRRQKAAYGKFSKEAGLLPRIERTGVVEYGRSISAKAVWADRKKGLTNGGGSGTMNTTTKLSENNEVVNPMDKSKYLRLKSNLEKNGVTVVSAVKGSDDEKFLLFMNAEAISDDVGILHLGEIPSASALYEEMIHCTQIKEYGSMQSDDYIERAAREVAANRKLLKNGSIYGFDEQDFKDIQTNLPKWEEEFKRLAGVSYDEAGINRDVSYIIGLENGS